MDLVARLITRSCTTGWADWIHGELWLSPDLLVRRRLTLQATRAHENRRTVPEPPPEVPVASLGVDEIVNAHSTNKVLPLDAVLEARLHRGILSDRLALRMHDGSRHKLLWLKVDPAYGILTQALDERLGHRLRKD